MDLATILGIISAFSLVIIAISIGSGITLFVDLPSALIVLGGTLGATLISYPLKDVLGVMKIVRNVFFHRPIATRNLISNFMDFSNKARREGILALEPLLREINDDFLKKSLQLCVDGSEPATIREILETEIAAIESRHTRGAEIFTAMGTYSPALGMIGTLIGLIQMLQQMDDPGSIGPAMAVALITTFYGAMLANLVFLPMAAKLRNRSGEETLTKEIVLEGILALSVGDHPRIVEQKLYSYMPSKTRKSSFE